MKNTKSMLVKLGVILGVFALMFSLAGTASAALTLGALTITSNGALTIDGAAASAITIGDAAQTGTISVGASTGAMTLNLGTGNSVKTINIGTGTAVDTINIGTGGTGVDVIAIGDADASVAITDADWSVTTAGAITTASSIRSSSASAGIGYATGAGCAVTQLTDRTTGVTCTGVSGAITTDDAILAAEGTAKFTVTNTSVAVGDVVVVSQRSGSDGGGTIVHVTAVAAGSFEIAVYNGNVAAGTAETGAIIINFAVIKAVSA
jgi:hypothetical protein